MARNFSAGNYLHNSAAAPISAYPLSMFCWWRVTNDSGAKDLMAVTNDNSNLVKMAAGGQHVIAYVVIAGGASYADNVDGYAVSTAWHNSVATFTNATDRKLYLNGGTPATNTTSRAMPGSLGDGLIGASRTDGTFIFTGDIAEPAIWNAELSAADVAVLNAGYSPLFVKPGNLVHYWPLIGRSSPELNLMADYTMPLVGAPTAAAHPRIIYPGSRIYMPPATVAPAGIPTHFMHYAKMRRG